MLGCVTECIPKKNQWEFSFLMKILRTLQMFVLLLLLQLDVLPVT